MPATAQILVTPTARLARNLVRELAVDKVADGQTAWLSIPAYSFSAWLSQLRDDYLLDSHDDRVPINAQQELVLWQSLIDRDVFIGEPQVANLAQRSWRTIHEYDLEMPDKWQDLLLSEDSRRFKGWAAAYRVACASRGLVDEWTFASDIPKLLEAGKIEAPSAIELIGFELPMTPLQQKILTALEGAGTQTTRRKSASCATAPPEILQFDEPDHELVGAAIWARDLLEKEPMQSIAVVVPDLSERVDRVDRLFRQVFDPPGFALRSSEPEPWHISLGKPLSDWPLVTDALAILSLADHRLSQPEATHLLHSPYLGGWQDEAESRNQTLVRLARKAPYDLTVNELQGALQQSGANSLAEHLAAWQRVRRESRDSAWPSEWAGRFQEELSGLGFGNGRRLDSREYQVLQRWHDLLEAVSACDVVTDTTILRHQALQMLAERASSAVFRERNTGVPVEVLGVEEALGSQFDELWITTLNNETWPGPTLHDALIPAAVKSRVPRATSDGCLEQAQLELAGLLSSATITRGSFARGVEETPIEITRLLPDCPVQLALPRPPPLPAKMAVPLQDTQAPALEGTGMKGGTGVLKNQSSCPFRAFAERRLNAIDLKPPRPGLNAGQRGTVIHKALELFWNGLADLSALNPEDQEQHVRRAAEAALDDFTGRFRLMLTEAGRLLEQRRTERALARWLDVERQRNNFLVIEHEHEITLTLAGLTLAGKIDRLDRLEDGTTMLIDYKTGQTGQTGKGGWFPEPRIADPQLPAYAVAMDPKPSAVAFARIRPDGLKFEGLAGRDAGTPGVKVLADEGYKFKELQSWGELLADWQIHIEALARDFVEGKAAVDPRKPSECKYCHLHALCRIGERAPYGSMTEGPDDE